MHVGSSTSMQVNPPPTGSGTQHAPSKDGQVVVKQNEVITEDAAKKIEALGYEKIRVRSPLACEAALGCCQCCYGMDLARGARVELGLAVGIIAAHEEVGSIGV